MIRDQSNNTADMVAHHHKIQSSFTEITSQQVNEDGNSDIKPHVSEITSDNTLLQSKARQEELEDQELQEEEEKQTLSVEKVQNIDEADTWIVQEFNQASKYKIFLFIFQTITQ